MRFTLTLILLEATPFVNSKRDLISPLIKKHVRTNLNYGFHVQCTTYSWQGELIDIKANYIISLTLYI